MVVAEAPRSEDPVVYREKNRKRGSSPDSGRAPVGCVAVRRSCQARQNTQTPENQLRRQAGLGWKVPAFRLRQRTLPAANPQITPSAATMPRYGAVQYTIVVNARAYVP